MNSQYKCFSAALAKRGLRCIALRSLDLHSVGVHGLASVELKVLDVGQKLLLDIGLGTLLEGSDFLSRSTLLLESSLDSLQVACSGCIVSGSVGERPSATAMPVCIGKNSPLR